MIYFNGKILSPEEIRIEYNDRGFLLSDGLFETMRAYHGKVFCLKEHYERLKKSADYLEIPILFSFSELENMIDQVLHKNNLSNKDASLRLTVTRGPGPRGIAPPDNPKPTIMLTAFSLQPHELKPVSCYITSIRRNEFSPLANIKTLSYLDNILARGEAVKKGADEGILLNSKGLIAEASAANIFFVTNDNILITPGIEQGVLPGITRMIIIELARKLKITVLEKSIIVKEAYLSREIFLTNSLIEIQPIIKLDDVIINQGEVGGLTMQLHMEYKNKVNNF